MVTDADAPESILARATHSQRSTLLSHFIRVLCKVLSVLVLARLVAPADHGLYAMAGSLTLFLTVFRDFGLGGAAVQAPRLTEDDRTTLYRAHLFLGFALCLATLALIPALVWFYDQPRLAPLLAVMSVHFLFLGYNAWPRVLLARDLQFPTLNRIETSAVVLATAVMIAAGALDAGAYSFAAFLLTFESSLMFLAWRACPWRPRGRFDFRRLRPLLRTGTDLTGLQTISYFAAHLDTFAVGRWFGPRFLGLYARPAQLLILPVQHIATPLAQVLAAALSRTSPQSDEFRIQLFRTTNLILHLTFPFATCCIALPLETTRIVLGPDWLDASPFLRWFGVGALFVALNATLQPLALALRRTRRLAGFALFSLIVTSCAVFIARDSGPVAIAAAVALVQGFLLLPRLAWIVHASEIRLRDFASAAFGPILASAAFATGLIAGKVVSAHTSAPFRFAVALACGGACIALATTLSARLRDELRYVWSHLPGRAASSPSAKGSE